MVTHTTLLEISYRGRLLCKKATQKKDKIKTLKTKGSSMKVKSIAECSTVVAFGETFDLHSAFIGLEKPLFGLSESVRFTQVLLYIA